MPACGLSANADTTSESDAPDDRSIESGGARIHVALDPDVAQAPADVLRWVRAAADAVSAYYGRFPVPRLEVEVGARRGSPVNSGTEFDGNRIVIHLDPGASPADLADDWTLVHEMFHAGFPSLGRDFHYMEEGLSDYLEPLARARAGTLSEQDVWRGFVQGMPQGLPRKGQGGLDGTRDWGRTYWGGCIFWLLVDLDIRERSGNAHSLDDAVRAIALAGGTGGAFWPVDRMIAVGDAATGTGSIHRIHELLGPAPVDPQLDAIWQRLGVQAGGSSFDETASLAAVRRSMTAPRP